MATAEAIQALQEELKKVADQARASHSCLNQLRSAKKDAEVEKKRKEVLDSLRTVKGSVTELQLKMQESETELVDVLGPREEQKEEGEKEEEADDQENKEKKSGFIGVRNLDPRQQEALYELKASRMGAMQAQNAALKRELALNLRKRILLNKRGAMTQSYPGSETLRAAHALEAKLRGANLKIQGLEKELKKSVQTTLRYRDLYEDSQREEEAEGAGKERKVRGKSAPGEATMMPKPAGYKEQSFIGPTTSVNDVVRKNEVLLEESEVQRREIARLKRDNAELILIAKTSAADRDSVLARLSTSETCRHDALKRFNKLKNEHTRVTKSFTRQAASWIDSKKYNSYYEAQRQWDDIHQADPHGGRQRWVDHDGTPQDNLPRQMFPVESYGGASQA